MKKKIKYIKKIKMWCVTSFLKGKQETKYFPTEKEALAHLNQEK